MNSQVINLLPRQAQNFAVQTTPLDVSNKPNGVSRQANAGWVETTANTVEQPKQHHNDSQDDLVDVLGQVNLSYDPFEIEAKFTMSKQGNRVIITLRNTRTGEIIRKIPPEDFTSRLEGSTGGLGLWFNQEV